jgi:phosphoenolpyruvate carboxylase
LLRWAARAGIPDPLRDDVRYLGKSLGIILREAGGPELLYDVEQLRALAIKAYGDDGDSDALEEAAQLVESFSLERADQVARAFTAYFHLVNLAEEYHRAQALGSQEPTVKDTDILEADSKSIDLIHESIPFAFRQLAAEIGPEAALERVNELEFHPVMTAHPTEARRRAISRAIRRITDLLQSRNQMHPTGTALAELNRTILAEIDILWRTSPLRVTKPTPIDEVKSLMGVFEQTLFQTFATVYRRLDDFLLGDVAGWDKPLAPAFVRLGSWIGADRDGNPFVTAQITKEASVLASEQVLTALSKHCREIARKLTVSDDDAPPSAPLRALHTKLRQMVPDAVRIVDQEAVGETHRATLSMIAARIDATIKRDADVGYRWAENLVSDLRVVQDSLVEADAPRTAYGQLQRLIWQVETFGFHMVEMEFRQHSQVHEAALAEIKEKGAFAADLSPMTVEVLDTFRALGAIQNRLGLRAARRFIVSFTQSAQHLADVYELAEYAFPDPEDRPTIAAIPLFETLADLQNAVPILDQMIEIPQVKARMAENGRRLEVMLGYSDSSKDVGPVAATLALDTAQSEIAAWADRNNIKVTLFHGRGGSLGRGGGPANRAVMAQPPGTVDGRFKLTEQGEIILARYGDPTIAARHIEQVAAAILLAGAPSIEARNANATAKYRELARALADASRIAFHDLVRAEGFAPWFAQVTPLEELGMLDLGSRPAKRGLSVNSLDDLRAIPWVFAWSQARLNLAGWYGLGTALRDFANSHPDGLQVLQAAFQEWPLFNTMIENAEMSLAKTDERIAERYLALGDRPDLTAKVLEELRLTREWVLKVTGDNFLLEHRPVLAMAVQLREPYIDALSLLQVRALRVLRTSPDLSDDERKAWQRLLLLSVNGVAAGLQNTG